jgi:DNA primase
MPKYVDFQQLKQEVSIEQVFPMLDLEMRFKGDQWRGECPVCDGGPRSLVVTKSKQSWYCFGCKQGGDLISLVAAVRDLPMKDAAIEIVEQLTTVPENSSRRNSSSRAEPEAEGAKETKKLQPLTYLRPDHEALEALGLSEATCDHFGAGYAPKGILRGRLAIPIHDLAGELVAYCGRAVKDGQTPVLTFPKGFDPSRYVFNLHRIGEGELYCTSDPLDVLLAFENGVENTIAKLDQGEENVVPFRKRNAS